MSVQSVSLYYREGSSDKEYHARIESKDGGYVVNFAYGRRGSTLSTGTKTNAPVDLLTATKIFDKLVAEKKAKGYTEGAAGTPYQHTEKEDRATSILPQLLNPIDESEVDKLIVDDKWCAQEKHDGRRILLQKAEAKIHGINRKGLLVGLPSMVLCDLQKIPGDFLVDGEMIGGQYYAFDLLTVRDKCWRERGYRARYDRLVSLIGQCPQRYLTVGGSAWTTENKRMLLTGLRQLKREGIVFKHVDAPYTPGRPNSGGPQLKHKFCATCSAVVAQVNTQRSVELRLLNGTGWVSAGNVTIPANHRVPHIGDVVEVRYLYAFVESGALYQPVYLGLRNDIAPHDCGVSQLKYKANDEEA